METIDISYLKKKISKIASSYYRIIHVWISLSLVSLVLGILSGVIFGQLNTIKPWRYTQIHQLGSIAGIVLGVIAAAVFIGSWVINALLLTYYDGRLLYLLSADLYYHLELIASTNYAYFKKEYKIGGIIMGHLAKEFYKRNVPTVIPDIIKHINSGKEKFDSEVLYKTKIWKENLNIVKTVLELNFDKIDKSFKKKYTPIITNDEDKIKDRVLGVIKTKHEIDLHDTSTMLNIEVNELKNYLYELIGSQIINGKFKNDKFVVLSDLDKFLNLLDDAYKEWSESKKL